MQRIMRLGLPFVVILTGLFIACAPKKTGSPTRVLIPWPTAENKYSLQTVELPTITNINKFEGAAAEFMDNPSLVRNTLSGAAVQGDFFTNEKGVFVAKDFKTLNLITVYAHIERLNQFMDQLELSSLIPLPRKIAVGLRSNLLDLPKTNNAIYIGPLDTIVILPYEESGLPISMNAGILAHEYFHAIFHNIILKDFLKEQNEWTEADAEFHRLDGIIPKPDRAEDRDIKCPNENPKDLTNKELNQLIFSGLNEGLADLWAWIYTGDPAFMSYSISGQSHRKLDRPIARLPTVKYIRDEYRTRLEENCNKRLTIKNMRRKAYTWGSSIAQFFVKLVESDFKKVGAEHRKLLAEKIIKSVKNFSTALNNEEKSDKAMSLNRFFQQYFLANEKASGKTCEFLSQVMAKEETELESANKVHGCP
ncbi:MAG: hypothetical protein SGJ18_06900 [Pseudomonadota bacterium]|nr:hypothetical protein [Pseudomonadota bacterium]